MMTQWQLQGFLARLEVDEVSDHFWQPGWFPAFYANQKTNNGKRKDLTSGLFDACGSLTTDLISNPKQRKTKKESLFLTGLISSTLSAKRALKSKAFSRCLYQDTLLIWNSKNIKGKHYLLDR